MPSPPGPFIYVVSATVFFIWFGNLKFYIGLVVKYYLKHTKNLFRQRRESYHDQLSSATRGKFSVGCAIRKFALNSLRGTENVQLRQCTASEFYVSVPNNENFAETLENFNDRGILLKVKK